MRSLFPIRLVRAAPVTAACLMVCVALFAVTDGLQDSTHGRLPLLDRWGAVVERTDRQLNREQKLVVDYELAGPIALWQGEIWRIPVCAFHHADLWHLLVNAAAAIYLGLMVERSFGSRNLLRLLPAAVAIPMIVEFLFGQYVLGFSGVVAAMFGVLCVLRMKNEELRERFPDEAVHFGGALLAAGVLFRILDLAPVAILAHVTGFLIGALAGCVATGLPWGKSVAWHVRAVMYGLAVASLWFVVYPTWDGTYHWYLAKRAPDDSQRIAQLQRAVSLNPQLVGAYRALADVQERQGLEGDTWRTILTGLSQNPADTSLLRLARRVWLELSATPNRIAARQAVRETFGENADVWLAQIEAESPDDDLAELMRRLQVAEVDPELEFPLDRAVDLRLPQLVDALRREFDRPRVPPEGDAVEGRRM